MGEHVWTTVVVGGKATTAILETDLVAAAEANFPGDNGGQGTAKEIVLDALKEGTSATFQGMCNFGNADVLTDFCRAHGLAYHKSWSAASGAFDAGVEFWAPGMEAVEEQGADDDGSPMASLDWLTRELKAGRDLASVVAELGRASSSNVPPLAADDLLSRMERAA